MDANALGDADQESSKRVSHTNATCTLPKKLSSDQLRGIGSTYLSGRHSLRDAKAKEANVGPTLYDGVDFHHTFRKKGD